MSNIVQTNNKSIDSGKRRINALERKRQILYDKAAKAKKEFEETLKAAREIEIEQSKIRRKNRTHAMIVLASSIVNLFPELAVAEKTMISNDDFSRLNKTILSQITANKNTNKQIDYYCKIDTNNNKPEATGSDDLQNASNVTSE